MKNWAAIGAVVLFVGSPLVTACAPHEQAAARSPREVALIVENARLRTSVEALKRAQAEAEQRTAARPPLPVVAVATLPKNDSPCVTYLPSVDGDRPDCPTWHEPPDRDSVALREQLRALRRLIDRLDLDSDVKRELLQGLRPARPLDVENPWIAEK